MKAELIFLGTGASAGIPLIGCHCHVCDSHDKKNKRLRPSCLLTINEKKILIDAGPDFRMQALTYSIERLDGVMITHTHYDHIGGLDELRIYYILAKKTLPLLLSQSSFNDLKKRLPYLFKEKNANASLPAQLDFQVLNEKKGNSSFLNIPFYFMTYEQGGMEVLGFRFGSLAYLSDIRYYSEDIFENLRGVDTLILSALKKTPSPLHFSVEEACLFAEKVKVKKAYLMHISHELEHAETSMSLPTNIELAYDGLKIEWTL